MLNVLTLPVPIPYEEKKINYFRFSLRCLKRFYERLKALHKTFKGTTKKCKNKDLIFILIQLLEMLGTGRVQAENWSCLPVESTKKTRHLHYTHSPFIHVESCVPQAAQHSLPHSICSLRNWGARYVGNKMPRQFPNFSLCLGNTSAKKLPKTRQKPLYITSTRALVYLGILPRDHLRLDLALLVLPKLYCLLYIFGFFMCACYSRKTFNARKTRCSKYSSVWKPR